MRLAVILNRNARRLARSPALVRGVERASSRAGALVFGATRTLEELDLAASEARRADADTVALIGGDGTFMAGVSALRRAYKGRDLPRLALVAGGTVARVAHTLGLAGAPVAAIASLAAGHPRPQRTQSLLVASTGATGRREEHVGFIFGTGLVASFFDVYNERGAHGVPTAAAIAGRVFLESFFGGPLARRVLDPLPCSLELPSGERPQTAWSLVACSVLRDLGLHLLVTYRAGDDPARLHLVASSLLPGELGPRAGRVLAGKNIGGAGHIDELVETFTLRFSEQRYPEGGPFVLDGDVIRARAVEVSVGPTLTVLR